MLVLKFCIGFVFNIFNVFFFVGFFSCGMFINIIFVSFFCVNKNVVVVFVNFVLMIEIFLCLIVIIYFLF